MNEISEHESFQILIKVNGSIVDRNSSLSFNMHGNSALKTGFKYVRTEVYDTAHHWQVELLVTL